MSASSMVFKLHSASAYGKSNSTIANSRLDSHHRARLVGGGVRATDRCELRRGAIRPAIEGSAKLAGAEIETNGADFVWLGDFRGQRASRSTRLLDQREGAGREGEERLAAPCFDRFSEGRRPQADRSFDRRGA